LCHVSRLAASYKQRLQYSVTHTSADWHWSSGFKCTGACYSTAGTLQPSEKCIKYSSRPGFDVLPATKKTCLPGQSKHRVNEACYLIPCGVMRFGWAAQRKPSSPNVKSVGTKFALEEQFITCPWCTKRKCANYFEVVVPWGFEISFFWPHFVKDDVFSKKFSQLMKMLWRDYCPGYFNVWKIEMFSRLSMQLNRFVLFYS